MWSVCILTHWPTELFWQVSDLSFSMCGTDRSVMFDITGKGNTRTNKQTNKIVVFLLVFKSFDPLVTTKQHGHHCEESMVGQICFRLYFLIFSILLLYLYDLIHCAWTSSKSPCPGMTAVPSHLWDILAVRLETKNTSHGNFSACVAFVLLTLMSCLLILMSWWGQFEKKKNPKKTQLRIITACGCGGLNFQLNISSTSNWSLFTSCSSALLSLASMLVMYQYATCSEMTQHLASLSGWCSVTV